MISRILLLGIFVICLTASASSQYFPRLGRAAIHQESLDAQSRLDVLSISLRPGYEDLAALAYFRLGKGARITSAYVTNGETGESDVRGEFPMHHAGELREEATAALGKLDGGALFLNMQDIPAAPGTQAVRLKWRIDTLRARLTRLILDTRPDVVLVARDWLGGPASPQSQVLEAELIRVLRDAESIKSTDPRGAYPWTVARVMIDKETKDGAAVPIDQVHRVWKKTYLQIGAEAGLEYHSIAVQRKRWTVESSAGVTQATARRYQALFPKKSPGLKRLDEGLPVAVPARLSEIGKGIAELIGATLRGQSTVAGPGGKKEKVEIRLVGVMQLLDRLMTHLWELTPLERKIALQWKLTLEDLRVALLGIDVRYRFEPNILIERQVALMSIDTIIGVKAGGATFLYFPEVDQSSWIVNEQVQKRMDFKYHEAFRILSPGTVPYHLPAGLQGMERNSTATSFLFYVIHQGAKPEDNFMYRIAEPVRFAPRFTAEVLSPMVSAVPSERVVVRLTNHSRDGVRDSVYVGDSVAISPKREFRLNTKGGAHQDTLILSWNSPLEAGTYVVSVKIADRTVSSFAARRFDIRMDSSRSIGLITGIESSPMADVLRRLGARWSLIGPQSRSAEEFSKFRVIVIDRRALTLDDGIDSSRAALDQFVQRGGHLVILAQDAGTWNSHPLIEGLTLTASGLYDDIADVFADSTDRLWTTPNIIARHDLSDWIYQVAYNTVSGPALDQARVPMRSGLNRSPFITMWNKGMGKITYADLAFNPQIFNVLPGAYRLLANLLSY